MHSPLHSVTPTLQQATTEPLLETAAHSRASLGQSLVESLLLSPGSWCSQGSVVPSKSLFPQSYVSSGGSMVGLMATSSKRAYATPRSTAPRAPASAAGDSGLHLHRRHSEGHLAQSLRPLLVAQCFVWALRVSLAGTGFDSKCSFAPYTIFLLFPLSQSLPSENVHKPLILIHQRADRLKSTTTENQMKKGASPLPLDVGYLFLMGSNTLLSMVVQQRVVILEFSQEKVTICPPTPPSWIPSKFILPINLHIKTFTAASIAEDQKQSKCLQ